MVDIPIAQSLLEYGALESVVSAVSAGASSVSAAVSGAFHAVAGFFASIPPTWAATAAVLVVGTWLFTRR